MGFQAVFTIVSEISGSSEGVEVTVPPGVVESSPDSSSVDPSSSEVPSSWVSSLSSVVGSISSVVKPSPASSVSSELLSISLSLGARRRQAV